MRKFTTRELTLAAFVAALYAVMSYFGNVFGLTFGGIQCRFAETLCVLPFFFPCTVYGLFVGCLITNLMSTVGPLDIVFGSMATLLAAMWTARMPNRSLAPLPPVICNGVIVGAMIAWYEVGFTGTFLPVFALNALWVALGEAVVVFLLGGLLLKKVPQSEYLRQFIPEKRQK